MPSIQPAKRCNTPWKCMLWSDPVTPADPQWMQTNSGAWMTDIAHPCDGGAVTARPCGMCQVCALGAVTYKLQLSQAAHRVLLQPRPHTSSCCQSSGCSTGLSGTTQVKLCQNLRDEMASHRWITFSKDMHFCDLPKTGFISKATWITTCRGLSVQDYCVRSVWFDIPRLFVWGSVCLHWRL